MTDQTQKETQATEPITRNPSGLIRGHGWQLKPDLTVRTNNQDDLATIPAEIAKNGLDPVARIDNFKLAFAITAKLVELGEIKINFDDPTWSDTIEICVDGILQTLNQH